MKLESLDFLEKMPQEDELIRWAELGLNVLLIGKHGVGKTSLIGAAFQKVFGDAWRPMTAPLLDPHLDLRGIPRYEDEDPNFFDFRLPKSMKGVKGLFFDELNRAHGSVASSLNEIVQHGTINGDRLEDLSVVWAAINPDVEGYRVEALDNSLFDRFHIIIQVPYELNEPYFVSRYGEQVYRSADEWFRRLNGEFVSPRKLDQALEAYLKHGIPLELFFPRSANPSALENTLLSAPSRDVILRLIRENKTEKIRDLAFNDITYAETIQEMLVEARKKMSEDLAASILNQIEVERLPKEELDEAREIYQGLFGALPEEMMSAIGDSVMGSSVSGHLPLDPMTHEKAGTEIDESFDMKAAYRRALETSSNYKEVVDYDNNDIRMEMPKDFETEEGKDTLLRHVQDFYQMTFPSREEELSDLLNGNKEKIFHMFGTMYYAYQILHLDSERWTESTDREFAAAVNMLIHQIYKLHPKMEEIIDQEVPVIPSQHFVAAMEEVPTERIGHTPLSAWNYIATKAQTEEFRKMLADRTDDVEDLAA